MPAGEGGTYVPKYAAKGVTNETVKCEARHECDGGGNGACDSFKNHGGRHTCNNCQELFSVAGEPGSRWCLSQCPYCEAKCRRQVGHSGRHTCDSDHTWSLVSTAAGRLRPMDHDDPGFALPLPEQKSIGRAASSDGVGYRFRDEGDGVDHWHCAHCGTRIPLNSSVCALCRYKICNACSEVNCPKTQAVRARDERGPGAHRHCAHCGARIP